MNALLVEKILPCGLMGKIKAKKTANNMDSKSFLYNLFLKKMNIIYETKQAKLKKPTNPVSDISSIYILCG